ncbi:MAG: sce7726 family protein, partial [Candidatus Obscuribacterales bacterium]|nr:sce7726 family protein [Candidatus Obscuribacterales bacterium]
AILKEIDIRVALHIYLHEHVVDMLDEPLIVDELGVLEGSYRVDLALIDRQLQGFEIKSASDNLNRLPAQQKHFGSVFDRMTLVCDQKHVKEAMAIVPSWWGLICVSEKDDRAHLNEIWPSRLNQKVDPYAVCQLLWRDEALALLKEHGMDHYFRSSSRKKMWRALAKELEPKEIRQAVKRKLCERPDWRQ